MSTVQSRLERWHNAVEVQERGWNSPDWQRLDREEQEAWDDMADHDDPEYVRILKAGLG